MLHQVFVKGVRDLQPPDGRNTNHIVVVVIHQGHIALEITDMVFEALYGLHLDREKVVVVLLKLPSGSVLVIESPPYLFETLK